MPSWLPGDDYMTNFKVGDPYVRVDDGYARLPGAGYEALHPELKGLNPEDYPDIRKLRILSDVAPYSREYNVFRQKVASQAHHDTELQIELDKIIDRVRQTKESSIRMDNWRFTAPVENQGSPSCLTQKLSRTRGRGSCQLRDQLYRGRREGSPSCLTQETFAHAQAKAADFAINSTADVARVLRPAPAQETSRTRVRAGPGFGSSSATEQNSSHALRLILVGR
jgi:hypothetical protein